MTGRWKMPWHVSFSVPMLPAISRGCIGNVRIRDRMGLPAGTDHKPAGAGINYQDGGQDNKRNAGGLKIIPYHLPAGELYPCNRTAPPFGPRHHQH